MKKKYRVVPEIREQILKRIKEEGVTVNQTAKEHSIAPNTVYGWLGRGVKVMPTIGELVRLKRQNEELLALVGEFTLRASRSQKKS
jgi:transposase-like protein